MNKSIISKLKTQKLHSESVGVSLQSLLIFVFLIHFLFLTWYFGINYGPRISWIPNDAPWSAQHSFGVHSFSDYLQIWHLAKNSYWEPINIYPPFAVFLIKLFTWTPYKPTVVLYLVLLCISTLLPLILGSKNRDHATRFSYVLILAVFTAPFISILDRGNLIGFLPALFYLALVLPPTRKVIIGILLGIVSAIKVYPLIFLLFLPKTTRLKTGSIAFTTFISLNLFSAFFWGNPITIARKILNAQKDFSSLNITGDSMNFSSSSIALNVANFILGSNSKVSQLIQYNSAIIGVFTLLLLLITAHFGYRAKNPITYPFLGLYALQLIPIISYTYTRWWGIVILGLLLNQRFMGRERDEKYEIFIWITVLMNSSLLNFNEFHPISIFPTISFFGVVAFCVRDVLTNLKFRQKSS